MLVCFCFIRFFCLFLWAFGVTNFPPIKVARQPTPDPKSQQGMRIFGNSTKPKWSYQLTALKFGISRLNAKEILDGLSVSSLH